jgi:hypothetical protein
MPNPAIIEILDRIRPLVKISELERLCRLPKNSIRKHYNHRDGMPNGRALPSYYYSHIIRGLCSIFGTIHHNGWELTASWDCELTFARCWVRNLEIIDFNEATEGPSAIFEYHVAESRIRLEDLDLVTWEA